MNSMHTIKTGIIILAAGKGTRMNHDPRTGPARRDGTGQRLPKVLVPVGGVPMILRVLAAVEAAKFGTKPIIVVGYKKELVTDIVGKRANYACQRRQLGTGHAVAAAAPLLKGRADEILIVYGDHPLTSRPLLQKLVRHHRKTKATMSLITVTVEDFRGPRRVFYHWGRIIRNDTGNFLDRCIEFKNATARQRKIKEVNSGYYCFNAKWLWSALKQLKPNSISEEYYLTDLMGLAVSEGRRVAPLPLTNWHEGIGVNTAEEIKIAERVAAEKSKI